jgi:hypothetical protein
MAILEADKSWRDDGKREAYSRHLANALVARLPGTPWISVDDRLPASTPGSDEVLFFSPDMRNPISQAVGILRYGRWLAAGHEFVNVTHWKPLDQPPPPADAVDHQSAHQVRERQTVERAADLLEHYAAFINEEKPDLERHPYVPELETTAESLRELIAITTESIQHEERLQSSSPARQALRDNIIRVERIVMLDAMLGDQLYPAQALEHLMQEPTDTLLSLFPAMPDWLRKALTDNVDFEEAFVDWINQAGLAGFVVQFATPAMKWDPSGESSTYTWGHYTTRWFYADSIDGAISMALGWVGAISQAEKSKGEAA